MTMEEFTTTVCDLGRWHLVAAVLLLPLLAALNSPLGGEASSDFPAYRMYQYDLYGKAYGCKQSRLNLEAAALSTTPGSSNYARRCLVYRALDLTVDHIKAILATTVGGLLVLLPPDWSVASAEAIAAFQQLESWALSEEFDLPVYFAAETPVLRGVHQSLVAGTAASEAPTAAQALVRSISAAGYQLVSATTDAANKPLPNAELTTLYGLLTADSGDSSDETPTVVIATHYDTAGMVPGWPAHGGPQSGTVAAFLETLRLLSLLYSQPATRPLYNVVFVLSAGGQYSYQGDKLFLEEQLDNSNIDNPLLSNVAVVVCLDGFGVETESDNRIRLHVSKPPRNGTDSERLVAAWGRNGLLVSKKINLADEVLSWQHERYSIKRLPALTLSGYAGPSRDPWARSLVPRTVDIGLLGDRTTRLVDSLGELLYSNTDAARVFQGQLSVCRDSLASWVDYLSGVPGNQALLGNPNQALPALLEAHMRQYLGASLSRVSVKPDRRDPDFMFYDVMTTKITAYGVKPAIFDLVVAIAAALYLGVLYLCVWKFDWLTSWAWSCSRTIKRIT